MGETGSSRVLAQAVDGIVNLESSARLTRISNMGGVLQAGTPPTIQGQLLGELGKV